VFVPKRIYNPHPAPSYFMSRRSGLYEAFFLERRFDAILLSLPPLLKRLLVFHPMTRLILVSHGETSDTEVFRAAVPSHTFAWDQLKTK
jgi:hypothetical protein